MHKIIDSLYIHFPFCTHLCNYCDFYKKVPTNIAQDFKNYHHYLTQSLIEHHSLTKMHGYSWQPLNTLYIGGGTPSLWGISGRDFLQDFLLENNLKLNENCEFTLEVNPGAWDDTTIKAWLDLGVNRFSLGIQTLNETMLPYLDRSHDSLEIFRTLEYFKNSKVNFSMDFMLGLPQSESNARDVIKELELALTYNPSHFSVYILTVKENYKYFKNLPNEEWIEKEYLLVAEFLKSNGFHHYEVSNFSLPNKKSIHNLNYWQSKTVAALGPSATGFLSEDHFRYKWKPNQPAFDLEKLSEEEFKLEQIYMALRSDIGLDVNFFPTQFTTLLEKWKLNGLAIKANSKVYLTSKGYLVLDSLINDLFLQKLL
jgi:oxygen-independent coproporphyrinogen-3 oxidase